MAKRVGDAYQLDFVVEQGEFAGLSAEDNQVIWHNRMGHLNIQDLQKLVSKDMAMGIDLKSNHVSSLCEPCVFGNLFQQCMVVVQIVLWN